MAKPSPVTAPELGKWLGLSEQAVRDLARRGVVMRSGRGRYALKESIRAYCEHMRRTATGRGVEITGERARLAKAQAELVEVKLRRIRGELIEAAAVEAEWSSVLRGVRAAMLAVAYRVGARLPHLTAHDIAMIDREVRDALAGAAEDLATPSEVVGL